METWNIRKYKRPKYGKEQYVQHIRNNDINNSKKKKEQYETRIR